MFYLKGCSALKILEAVGWEKGILERSIGEEPVEDLERGLSLGLVVPFCICLSQCVGLYGEEERSRGTQTWARAGFDVASPLCFGFLFGVSMPRARCDSLVFRQRNVSSGSKMV